MSAEVNYAPDGAVSISYHTLISAPETLGPSIEKAFGSSPECLGIIVIKDLPSLFGPYRERLLKLAYRFSKLDEAAREKYMDASSNYSFGWSHGKEIMNGKPDILKGSYYANPVLDHPSVPSDIQMEWKEYYTPNIWPTTDEVGLEGFEQAFKDLGRFIFDIGCALAVACQPFALAKFTDSSLSLSKMLSTSQTTKARLLHYFPPTPEAPLPAEDGPVDSWCGFHLDHSMLTGLCSANLDFYLTSFDEQAIFLREPNTTGEAPTVVPSPSPTSGLYIRNRGGELTKVSIPPDCIAFQTGEALEIATGGKLRATPHCVRVGAGTTEDLFKISRETFALFMQPDVEQSLSPTVTFGEFSRGVFTDHYGEK